MNGGGYGHKMKDRKITDFFAEKCVCSCHMTNEPNCICYSCECDIAKMPKKQNTITLEL